MTELSLEPAAQSEPIESPLPVQSSRVVVKANKLAYLGRVGETYRIWLLNIFLTIITIGIYSFWGKTRMRRYVAGHFVLGGDHFEYTGTGKELFIGFLKVFPFFIMLSVSAQFLPPAAVMGMYTLLLLFVPVIIYMAMRYRLNRTTWRGIRGRLTGSAFSFGGFALWRMFLNVITLGILIPASDIAMHSYMMNRAGFGNIRARYEGRAGGLIVVNIITLVLVVVIVLAAGFLMTALLAAGDVGVGLLVVILLEVALIIMARSFYSAALQREKLRGLTLGPIRFKTTATGFDICRLRLGNILLLVFTLGLGFPVVIQRNMNFTAKHVIIGGDLNGAEIMQAVQQNGAVGEGLDDLLGIDGGFGIG
jgi:uncharacterized membrane protein YjgN (DUF898 family)